MNERGLSVSSKNIINIETARKKKEPSKKKKDLSRKSKQAEKKNLSPRARKKRNRRRLFYVIVIGIVALILFGFAGKIIALKAENARLLEEQKNLLSIKKELQQEKKNVNSLDYIEQQAREQLHLVLPGEILYVLPDEKKTEG